MYDPNWSGTKRLHRCQSASELARTLPSVRSIIEMALLPTGLNGSVLQVPTGAAAARGSRWEPTDSLDGWLGSGAPQPPAATSNDIAKKVVPRAALPVTLEAKWTYHRLPTIVAPISVVNANDTTFARMREYRLLTCSAR